MRIAARSLPNPSMSMAILNRKISVPSGAFVTTVPKYAVASA